MAQDHAVPEEGEQPVVPGDDSNSDPTPPLPAGEEENREPGPPSRLAGGREEPEMASERDIPSDGADTLGECMIRTLTPAPQTSAQSAGYRK